MPARAAATNGRGAEGRTMRVRWLAVTSWLGVTACAETTVLPLDAPTDHAAAEASREDAVAPVDVQAAADRVDAGDAPDVVALMDVTRVDVAIVDRPDTPDVPAAIDAPDVADVSVAIDVP